MRNIKESRIQSLILKDLRSLGKYCECFKVESPSDNGVPDIFFTTKETGAVFVEVKRPSGVLSKFQKEKLEKLNSCGTKAFACYSWEGWALLKSSLGLSK